MPSDAVAEAQAAAATAASASAKASDSVASAFGGSKAANSPAKGAARGGKSLWAAAAASKENSKPDEDPLARRARKQASSAEKMRAAAGAADGAIEEGAAPALDAQGRTPRTAARQRVAAAALKRTADDREFLTRELTAVEASGQPTRLAKVSIDGDMPMATLADCSMRDSSVTPFVAATTAAKRAGQARHAGPAPRDIQLRHQQLVEGSREAPRARSEVARAVANSHAAALRPPPGRFWALLGAWALLGLPLCAHRLLAQRWRTALVQLCMLYIGAILVVVATTEFSPQLFPKTAYPYVQAFTAGGVCAGFTTLAGLYWLADGVLLFRGRLRPSHDDETDAGKYDAFSTHLSNEWWLLLGLWAIFGAPFGAHRWRLRHGGRAALQIALNVGAVAFGLMGSFGSLEGAYALSIAIGAAAMIGGIWLWIRDLIQLLRGRLGPARAATPRFWQLLLCLLFLGPLGLHRRLLGRSYSWLVFPLLTAAIGLCAADAIAQFTFGHHLDKEWGGISAGQATWALELGMGGALLVALAIASLHDLVHVLKGQLRPRHESALYWRVLYSWLALGLPVGFHRRVAGLVTWKLFAILNLNGIGLIFLGERLFRMQQGDPGANPSRFSYNSVLAANSLGGFCLFLVVLLWLYDAVAVARGRLVKRPEDRAFWAAVHTWLLPSGYLGGFHFISLGRPLDWEVYSSCAAVGAACAVCGRQFASQPEMETTTSFMMLITGLSCFGINLLRFNKDGVAMRPGSWLVGTMSREKMRTVRDASWTPRAA